MRRKILISVLIFLILALSFVYWLNYLKPETETYSSAGEKTAALGEISQEEAIKIAQGKYPGEVSKITEEKISVSKKENYAAWVVYIDSGKEITEVSINKKTGEIISGDVYPKGGEKEIYLEPKYEGGQKPQ